MRADVHAYHEQANASRPCTVHMITCHLARPATVRHDILSHRLHRTTHRRTTPKSGKAFRNQTSGATPASSAAADSHREQHGMRCSGAFHKRVEVAQQELL